MQKKYTDLIVGDAINYFGAELQVVATEVHNGIAKIACKVLKKAGLNMRWSNADEKNMMYTLEGNNLMNVEIK